MEKKDRDFRRGMQGILNGLMLLLFLPVLFCVMFIGNKMDYFDDVKADILVPNALLAVFALVALGICLWLIKQGRKWLLTERTSRYMDGILVVLFVGFYFFCMAITRETVFDMAVDPVVVRIAAKDVAEKVPFGYRFEFSMNHNNLPITYVLGRLYRLAESWEWFRHDSEYLWVSVGCMLVTIAGFCCCEMVKKLTRNPVSVIIAFLLYLATAGVCPWKSIPYTDSYGIVFPIFCFWLYLCSRECEKMAGKIPLLFMALLFGVMGGFLKPNSYITVLAVLSAEGVEFLAAALNRIRAGQSDTGQEERTKAPLRTAVISLLCSLAFSAILVGGAKSAKTYIIKDIELDYNEEIEATAQYFFFMGTNELTTGSFNIDDYGVFGEFQFSKADRNAACMERAWARMKDRGGVGTISFWLKKLVKSFNDGSFAWTDVRYYEPFPEDLTHDNRVAGYLRSLFVPGGANQGKYDTLAVLVWMFILMGVPGIVLAKGKNVYVLFPIFTAGFLVYLMLFESGARYVYIFLPVFIVMSVCGMEFIGEGLGKRTYFENRKNK